MFYVYVIRSLKDGRLYVGFSSDVDRRLREHNSGKTRSTAYYRPWTLLMTEPYESRLEARKREKYLKSGFGKEWIKNKWPRSSTG